MVILRYKMHACRSWPLLCCAERKSSHSITLQSNSPFSHKVHICHFCKLGTKYAHTGTNRFFVFLSPYYRFHNRIPPQLSWQSMVLVSSRLACGLFRLGISQHHLFNSNRFSILLQLYFRLPRMMTLHISLFYWSVRRRRQAWPNEGLSVNHLYFCFRFIRRTSCDRPNARSCRIFQILLPSWYQFTTFYIIFLVPFSSAPIQLVPSTQQSSSSAWP